MKFLLAKLLNLARKKADRCGKSAEKFPSLLSLQSLIFVLRRRKSLQLSSLLLLLLFWCFSVVLICFLVDPVLGFQWWAISSFFLESAVWNLLVADFVALQQMASSTSVVWNLLVTDFVALQQMASSTSSPILWIWKLLACLSVV